MKFLVDENLSFRLAAEMTKNDPGTSHVSENDLSGSSDAAIWTYAKEQGYIILTKDNDFNFLSFTLGCPPKVIRLGCGNRSTAYISLFLKKNRNIISDFHNDTESCYLELTD